MDSGRAGRSGVNLSGKTQRFISLIIIRGLYEYQTFIRVSEAASDDYDLLIRRMLDTVGWVTGTINRSPSPF